MGIVTKMLDQNALIGFFGTSLTVALNQVSVIISIIVGVVTAVYMGFKAYGEYKKIKGNG